MLLRFACALLLSALYVHAAGDYFRIRIVDQQTGRGVPLVALTTNNHITAYTDSNGIVAWNEPGLMEIDVYFRIESPGYRFPGGGKAIPVRRGGSIELKIERLSIAERLYRVTGQGIYRDSMLTGYPVPLRQPVLNAQVLGQDTVRVVPYRGRLFWLWGDTDRAGGPLGNFSTTSATSELPGRGGLDPNTGVDLTYFTGSSGFVKSMCNWPVKGMKWLHALMTLPDAAGVERLLARYDVVVKDLKAEESGLAVFNDQLQQFDKLLVFPHPDPAVCPGGIPPFRVRSGGAEYFYFCDLHPVPVVRVRADWKSVTDLNAYEVFDGTWKRGAALPPIPARHAKTWLDIESGNALEATANVHWNPYRRHWIGILQKNPGEVWYAEADTPTGPWVYATRIASNGNYFFYWPVQHPFLDQDGGRRIYFEGTYTDSFSGNPVITPRYNYNQLMYRLSLDDPRLFLPAPVYRLKNGRYRMREQVEAEHSWQEIDEIAFFALAKDRQRPGTVEVNALFRALPLTAPQPSAGVLGAWNCSGEFSLDLAAKGEQLTVEIDGATGSGTLRRGLASFVIRLEGGTYRGSASLQGGKLKVAWKDPRNAAGEIACERVASSGNWTGSTALVPLYFYDGQYTTRPKSGINPIARVWRSPVGAQVLDRDASPP